MQNYARKKLIKITFLAFVLVMFIPVNKVHAENTLAEVINECKATEQSYAEEVHYATIFSRSNLNAYDNVTYENGKDYVWLKTLADIDNYESKTIDEKVKSALSSVGMIGHMPITCMTTEGTQPLIVWQSYDRYMYNAYDYAKQFNIETSRWNKIQAGQEVLDCYHKAGTGLLGFDLDDGWMGKRYYDEYGETLDLLNKFGFVSDASHVWSDMNRLQPNGHWTGKWYGYTVGDSEYECEMGSFALLIGNYFASQDHNISNFDRIITDLYNKMLVDDWNSPAWGVPAVVHHGEYSPVLRLESTLVGFVALHAYYCLAPEYWRTKFRNMIDGNLTKNKAWELLTNSYMFSNGKFSFRNDKQYDDYATWCGMMNLFLEGIIPDTGSLAIPLNEWRYQDWATMLPATHFNFNYNDRKIRIPVFSGKINFQFGTNTVSVSFPSDGIYEVTFDSNWNNVLFLKRVSSLDNFYYLESQSIELFPPPLLLIIAFVFLVISIVYKKQIKRK